MLSTYLLYIKSIFVDINIGWCSDNYYNDGENKRIDIWNFKSNALNFFKLFTKYYIIGLQSQTSILDVMINNEIRDYYQNLLGIRENIFGGRAPNIQNNDLLETQFKQNKYSSEKESKQNKYSSKNKIKQYLSKKYTKDMILHDNHLITNLFEYIKYANQFYEYNSENKYIETIQDINSYTKIIEIIPKTIKNIYYDNEIELDNYVLNQELLVESIFYKIIEEKLKIIPQINPEFIIPDSSKEMTPIDNRNLKYKNKYLKYKNKYLQLKNIN
jgi:hypothetical protein